MPPTTPPGAGDPEPTGRLVLVRHGQTEWSRDGRHTGLTDLPLTAQGEAMAAALAPRLAGFDIVRTVTSPLQRARHTAELAGLLGTDRPGGLPERTVEVDPRLVEWDYGGYEGLTTAQIRATTGHPWTIFTDPVPPGATPGETIDQVADRCRSLCADVLPDLARGDVALVGHGHCLRVLAATFLGQPAQFGAALLLDAGALSVLEFERDVPAVRLWNAAE